MPHLAGAIEQSAPDVLVCWIPASLNRLSVPRPSVAVADPEGKCQVITDTFHEDAFGKADGCVTPTAAAQAQSSPRRACCRSGGSS